jgi:mRNA interferase RelE/StbE
MYDVKFIATAQKQLQKLPPNSQNRIVQKIEEISSNPRLSGYIKLSNRDGYRVRIGDYRIIYDIFDAELIVLIINIDHRKQVYK